MDVFLLKKNQDGLFLVLEKIANNNIKLKVKVAKELYKYKNSRREVMNKTQQRLYYRSIQHLKDNLETDLALQLISYRMKQFAMWFTYMWNNPSLCPKTFYRLSAKYPYRKTHFLRRRKIWIKKPQLIL
tara:strand:- start:142 stop:528 length:387 start_codon:yes stop_codon:yes gene_type:complete